MLGSLAGLFQVVFLLSAVLTIVALPLEVSGRVSDPLGYLCLVGTAVASGILWQRLEELATGKRLTWNELSNLLFGLWLVTAMMLVIVGVTPLTDWRAWRYETLMLMGYYAAITLLTWKGAGLAAVRGEREIFPRRKESDSKKG